MRIRIRGVRIISLDPDPYKKSWIRNPDPSQIIRIRIQLNTLKTKNNFNFLTLISMIIYRKVIVTLTSHTWYFVCVPIHKTWNMSVFLSHLKDFNGTSSFFAWIRIRIVFAWIRIRNEFFHILDPYQNDTDPPH